LLGNKKIIGGMVALHYSKEKMKQWRNFSDAVLKTDIKRKAVSTYLKLNAMLRQVFFINFFTDTSVSQREEVLS